ncbi:conserved hypothetical protein [Burkholderiales bacterium 8X]|nr:conserved hypothetical protein [Burkholderiales bacterium 8X]
MKSIDKRFLMIASLTVLVTLLTACGSRRHAAEEPEPPEPTANARNTLIVHDIVYGKTATGLQLGKEHDICDVPRSLGQSIREQVRSPYEFVVAKTSPEVEGAPTLRITMTDILANAGGWFSGPKMVELHGVLERPGVAPMQFTAQRQRFIRFGPPRGTCTMVSWVTWDLGSDIVQWLKKPVDGAKLEEL